MYIYTHTTKDGLLNLQQIAQLEEQYNSDSLRNNYSMRLKHTFGVHLTIDRKSVTVY